MTKPHGFPERLAQERRLKQAREARDIPKKDVAKAIGVSESTLGRWENGIGNIPNDDQLEKLAAYYGVTAAWLRYGVETKSGAERMAQHKQSPPVIVVPRKRGQGGKGD